MSAHSVYTPQSPFMQWLERRLPIASLVYSSFVVYPTPRNLNYWWTFGGILSFMLGAQIVTGIVLAMHYTPHVDFAFNSVESIMRDVNYGWLLALPAFERRFVLLCRRLCPHRTRHVLRLLQGSARGAVDSRRHPVPAHGGHRLHGLRAAVGADELLGRDRHHQPVLGDPRRRRPDRDLAVGRLCRRQSDAEPLLLAALPAAVRDRRGGRAAHLGAAYGRTEQPDRGRAEDREGYVSRSRPTRPSKTRSLSACSCCSSPGSSSTSPTISATPTITFRPIPARRRPTSCRNGTTCRSTPSCARSRASSWASSHSSRRSCSLPSCPGLIRRACARRIIGRSIGNS